LGSKRLKIQSLEYIKTPSHFSREFLLYGLEIPDFVEAELIEIVLRHNMCPLFAPNHSVLRLFPPK